MLGELQILLGLASIALLAAAIRGYRAGAVAEIAFLSGYADQSHFTRSI
ncbi:MAG: hypothetical protein ACK4U0_06595 [Mesorhizobium sp.]